MKATVIANVIGTLDTVNKELLQGMEDLEIGARLVTIQTTVIKIGQNTEKNPGDPRKLAVSQTQVKDHLSTLRKTHKK